MSKGLDAIRAGLGGGAWPVLVVLGMLLHPQLMHAQQEEQSAALASRAVYSAGFQDRLVAQFPSGETTSMAFAPDGRLFVTMKDGHVWVIEGGHILPEPFLQVPVTSDFERGLQSLAFDPDFASNGFIYVYYTTAASSDQAPRNRVSRFRASESDPNQVEPGSEQVLVDEIPGAMGHHNGGALHFGPDGKLYVATGDGQRAELAQDLASLSGKILRVNPDGTAPDDNPFMDQTGARGEVWALGFRNPFTMAIHPESGMLAANDVGTHRFEEVNIVEPGGNYGWPICEGPCGRTGLIDPAYAYISHDEDGARAITGGVFYTADAFPPEYRGMYFFSDYIAPEGWLKALDLDTHEVTIFATGLSGVLDLDIGPDGALYYLSIFDRAVYRIAWTGELYPVAVVRAEPTAGAPPLSVRFSAVGSRSPDAQTLSYSWDLGDGTRLIGSQVEHTYTEPGAYMARVVVEDKRGLSDQAALQVEVLRNAPPVGLIEAPAPGTRYRAGDSIGFAASATDPEDGPLPAEAFSWTVLRHHNDHTHPFLGPLVGIKEGTFTVPSEGEWEGSLWYVLYLTVTDSDGGSHQVTRAIFPELSTLMLGTDPPGLTVTIDGVPYVAPTEIEAVIGHELRLNAPQVQTYDGITYVLKGWSDGAPSEHRRQVPAEPSTIVARYDAHGLSFCPADQIPNFAFGFRTLKDHLGDAMGEPVSCEFGDPDGTGDILQRTTTGLAYWRASTNTPTFTNGWERWAATEAGLAHWTGEAVDPPSGGASAGD